MNDEDAFAAFYRETSAGLWRYLRRLAGDGAEDLLQEAYVRFLRAPVTGDDRPRTAYLYRIATNLARDRWRREKREEGWLGRRFAFGSEGSALSGRADLRVDLDAALGRLGPRERALLWLAYVEGYDHREIAEILGLRAGSVRVLLFRARRKVAGALGKEPEA